MVMILLMEENAIMTVEMITLVMVLVR